MKRSPRKDAQDNRCEVLGTILLLFLEQLSLVIVCYDFPSSSRSSDAAQIAPFI